MILLMTLEHPLNFLIQLNITLGSFLQVQFFLPDLLDDFFLQGNDQFRFNVFYKSESKYQIIKSCEERCMNFL